MQDNDPKKLITVTELASRWSVHPRSIRRLIASGKLPAYRIALSIGRRSVRIRLEDVINYEEFH